MDLQHSPAEVHIDAELVQALLADQHPQLSNGSLTLVDEGWDNVTFRVGSDHAVRIPRRQAAVDLLLAEQKWLHGDLHPRNVLVRDGALAGIIDWGDVTAGDVATDVACAWMLFDSVGARAAFLEAYAPSDAVLARAAGWAVNFASALLDSGEPRHAQIGIAVKRRLLGST